MWNFENNDLTQYIATGARISIKTMQSRFGPSQTTTAAERTPYYAQCQYNNFRHSGTSGGHHISGGHKNRLQIGSQNSHSNHSNKHCPVPSLNFNENTHNIKRNVSKAHEKKFQASSKKKISTQHSNKLELRNTKDATTN